VADVLFADPSGMPFQLVTLDTVLALIDKQDDAYWNDAGGSGNASLYFYSRGQAASKYQDSYVDFTMKNGVGYHFYYCDTPSGVVQESYYAARGKDFAEYTWISQGGTQVKVPTALFVEREQALAIVRAFFASGQRSKDVLWLPPKEIPWRTIQSQTLPPPRAGMESV
jgi:hypothetical protein